MVDVALHIEHGGAAGRGDIVDVLIANLPVALANGDAVEVAAHDLADLFGGVAVADLGGRGIDEGCVPAQLRHARLEAGAGAGAGEKEEHGQGLVAQQRVRDAQRAVALELEGHIENRLDLFFAEIHVADVVATAQVGLHALSSVQ